MSAQISSKETPGRAWLMGFLAWAIPGSGHAGQGRIGRGLLLGAAALLMFALGLAFGGHLFVPTDLHEGPLALIYSLFNLGMGAVYLFCWAIGLGFADQAQRATYEYGNIFLMIAGLLNYLAMLDAFDIAAGRKS